MSDRKPKNIFTEGAIPAAFIADSIQKHSTKKNIGGHSIFLGQVRADVIDDSVHNNCYFVVQVVKLAQKYGTQK